MCIRDSFRGKYGDGGVGDVVDDAEEYGYIGMASTSIVNLSRRRHVAAVASVVEGDGGNRTSTISTFPRTTTTTSTFTTGGAAAAHLQRGSAGVSARYSADLDVEAAAPVRRGGTSSSSSSSFSPSRFNSSAFSTATATTTAPPPAAAAAVARRRKLATDDEMLRAEAWVEPAGRTARLARARAVLSRGEGGGLGVEKTKKNASGHNLETSQRRKTGFEEEDEEDTAFAEMFAPRGDYALRAHVDPKLRDTEKFYW